MLARAGRGTFVPAVLGHTGGVATSRSGTSKGRAEGASPRLGFARSRKPWVASSQPLGATRSPVAFGRTGMGAGIDAPLGSHSGAAARARGERSESAIAHRTVSHWVRRGPSFERRMRERGIIGRVGRVGSAGIVAHLGAGPAIRAGPVLATGRRNDEFPSATPFSRLLPGARPISWPHYPTLAPFTPCRNRLPSRALHRP